MERQVLGKTTASYSPGLSVPAGQLIFISGTIAVDDQGKVIAPGNMERQARAVFEQIGRLLTEAGATFKDVVKITTFVTDMSQYSQFAAVRKEVFGGGPYPTSTAVQVSRLVYEGLVIEVEAIAVL